MNRIEKRLDELKQAGKKAFITYTTAGLPDLDTTEKLIYAQDRAGADILEIGIPFSDPVADGPVIQDASFKAIQNGATLVKIFDVIEKVRENKCEVPVIFMMYYNTIFHYGISEFVKKCTACGVDGLIVPDLPFEEQGELKEELAKNDAAPILIQLVSPVSKQRVPMLLENARGFVYCVSQMGVTGKSANFHKDIIEYLTAVKNVSKIPVMVGFGIRTPKDIEPFENIVDGAIVGSNLLRVLEESNYSVEAVEKYVSEFKQELNQ
jgi:tryptophan synthase alpha chain